MGWRHEESRCYVINDVRPPNQKTWDGAQAVCKERMSELAVINNAKEKVIKIIKTIIQKIRTF